MDRYADRCIRHHIKQATCDACIQVCPVSAISWQGEMSIDSDLCQDCGLCRSACPQGVFTHETYSIQYPSIRSDHKGYACRETKPMDGLYRLPCLGMLDETELVTASVQQTDSLELWFGHCVGCAWKQGQKMALQSVERAETILQFLQIDVQIRCHVPEQTARSHTGSGMNSCAGSGQQPAINRRDLFYMGWKWAANQSKKQVAQKLNQVADRLAEPTSSVAGERNKKKPPARRFKLLQLLVAKGMDPAQRQVPNLSLQKRIRHTCNHCRLCTETCPNGALTYLSDDRTGSVHFSHTLCTDCNGCLDVCPEQAIINVSPYRIDTAANHNSCTNTHTAKTALPNRILLSQTPLADCPDCGQTFPQLAPDQERCGICQNRKELLQNIWASTERD